MTPSDRIDQYILGISDWRGEVLAIIRRAMLEADPGVAEAWKWMGSPVWECDGIIAVANAHKGKVKVTFDKGAHLADVDHLFNAGLDGNKWRAIDLLENDRLDEPAFGRLVRTAIAYNRAGRNGKAATKATAKGASKGATTGAAKAGAKPAKVASKPAVKVARGPTPPKKTTRG
jgi:hypothetical protein